MDKCKVCGREFASTNPKDEICYPCKNALKRLNGYAVPVVRCKDCKHWDKGSMSCNLQPYGSQCEYVNWYEKDFCSYGERKDNG